MSGTENRKDRILLAAEAFVRAMRVPGSGTLAQWESAQKAALHNLIDAVEEEQAIDATDS